MKIKRMPIVNITCRFCRRPLLAPASTSWPNFTSALHTYRCEACDSTQFYKSNGESSNYWFSVNKKYTLYFSPRAQAFQIFKYEANSVGKAENELLTLNFIPHHLTPQNTTEERIRKFILFS